jgi:hypothetical protein
MVVKPRPEPSWSFVEYSERILEWSAYREKRTEPEGNANPDIAGPGNYLSVRFRERSIYCVQSVKPCNQETLNDSGRL